jgi:hypothetical protein
LELKLKIVLDQLKKISSIDSVEIEWFLTADLKFLSSFVGHIGASANYPCILCETTSEDISNVVFNERNLESVKGNVENYRTSRGAMALRNKKGKGYQSLPLFPINFQNIIPPPFHIIQGLASRFIDLLETDATEDEIIEFNLFLKEISVARVRKQFTGHKMSRLLKSDFYYRLTMVTRRPEFFELFRLLIDCHQYAESRFLTPEEEELFDKKIEEFYETLTMHLPREAVSPKLHWFFGHVIPFIKRHHTWAFFSDQGIEGIHNKFNNMVNFFFFF